VQRCLDRVPCWRHPFAIAPYAGPVGDVAVLPLPLAAAELEEQDRALLRSLRPEAAAAWALTLGSALLSIAIYWDLWGRAIAAGLVWGMWCHELGHAAVMRKLGVPRSPIVFVPFIGAMQRVRQFPARPLELAALALAGPAAGIAFAAVCKLGYVLTANGSLRFLAMAHAILALIDLLPFGVLDGARVLPALKVREAPRRAIAATYALLVACALALV
jgi:Zn-dependent protease